MLNRRHFIASAAASVSMVGASALALTTNAASDLVTKVTDRIIRVVNSGTNEAGVAKEFEKLLGQYADMPVISRSVLGPIARSTSQSDLAAFSNVLPGYLSRKYSSQFHEFKGGSLAVSGTRDRGKFIEVTSTARVPGKSAIDVTFRVWDRSGSAKFIDLLVEGVSLVTTERSEIGALLDQRGGSVSRLARDMKKLG